MPLKHLNTHKKEKLLKYLCTAVVHKSICIGDNNNDNNYCRIKIIDVEIKFVSKNNKKQKYKTRTVCCYLAVNASSLSAEYNAVYKHNT